MSAIQLRQLPQRPENWDDLIRGYATKTIFHESAWLDLMLVMNPGASIDYFEIRRHRNVMGYFCALRRKKFFISFYRNVWFGTTAFQGPVVNEVDNQAELISALMFAAAESGVQMVQLRNDWLDETVMKKSGFNVMTGQNHVCPLPDNEADAWQTMKGTCRTRIRKAEKEGLVAEVTEDPSIADKFYSFYRDTLKAKGLRVSYDANCYRELFSRMSACKHLFAVSVKHEGEIIGAGFYMFDERAMYYLDSASDPAQLALCPNELLHWTAMKMAIARGIPAFNIGGGPVPSRFTTKFGGNAETYHEFSKSLNPLIHPAQVVYRAARRINKNARRAMVAVAGITLAYLITDAYAATINHPPSDGVVVTSSSATTQR